LHLGLSEPGIGAVDLSCAGNAGADDFGSAEWAHPDIEFVLADGEGCQNPVPSSRGPVVLAHQATESIATLDWRTGE
jgi:hypothetical protein